MRTIEIDGYGKIHFNTISFTEAEAIEVDNDGNEVKRVITGKSETKFIRVKDEQEVAKNLIQKKFFIDDEEVITGKFTPTKKVEADEFEVIEDRNNEKWNRGLDRTQAIVFTDSQRILNLLNEGKALSFPIRLGTGYKVWNGILNYYTTLDGERKLALLCFRGNTDEGFKMKSDNPIEIKLDVMPKATKQNINKLFKLSKA